MKTITPLVIFLSLAATLTVQSAVYAQQLTIQPAADGTGTIVNPEGNTFNITGGTTSSSGANLFQSFTSFGLSSGQVANFLSAPNTQNILSRVTGGSFSLIDGLLKVTGSSANLFLLNPSGIVFGPNASLNVPAAFTATTANGIAFGSQWFNAFGPNNYAALNGSPGALGFTMSKPGAIINAGNLSVGPGQALSLIGGTVASTGQLSGGQVTVAAVPGEHYVRLGQPGSPLSIEVPISGAQLPTNWDLPIYSLSELLTGTGAGLTVADDGTVHLIGSQLTVENGDVVVRKIDAESAMLSANRNVTLPDSQLETTKDLLIQAKDTVTARDSKENPVLVKAGGNLTIQGDKSVDLLALNHPGQAFQSGGNLRLVSDGNVSGDAHFGSGGKFSIETLAGKPGKFVSLYDPIISSGNDVSFGNYTGVSLKVESGGNITGGNIKITGPDFSIPGDVVDADTLKTSSALILKAGVTLLDNPPSGNISVIGTGSDITIPSLNEIGAGGTIFETPGGPSSTTPLGTITLGSLTTLPFTTGGNGTPVINNASGPIILDAPGDITINGSVNAGELLVNTPGTATFNKSLDVYNLTTDAGGITVLNGNVKTVSDQTYKDNIQLSSSLTLESGGGSISFGGTVNSQSAVTNSLDVIASDGNVTLNGPVGNARPLSNLKVIAADDISLAGIGTTTQAGVTGDTELQTSGTTTFNNSVFANNLKTDAGGITVLKDNVKTLGGQTYSDDVDINGSLTLASTSSGSISFGGNVDAGRTGNLTVNTLGTTTFNKSVLANNLTTDAGGLTVLNGNVTTVGGQTYNDNVDINGSLTLASTSNGSITFGNSVDAGNTGNLMVNTSGTTTFNKSVLANNLTTDAGGLTVLNGNVMTLGNQTYNDNVQLNSSLFLASISSPVAIPIGNGSIISISEGPVAIPIGNGSIIFGGTVNSQPTATNTLAVITNGNVTLDGLVGNTQPLGNLAVVAGNISLAGIGTTTQAGVIGNTDLQAVIGNTDLQAPGGNITFTGNTYNANTQNYVGNSIAVNGGNTTFTASSDPITFKGPITLGNSSFTITGASTIDTNNINGGTGLINFTAANTINSGNIAINGGAISLEAPQVVNLDSANSGIGNITITSDEINFTGAGNISSTGNLVLQPFTPSQAITINNGNTDLGNASLDLTAADLSHLSDGFGNITIGRTKSTGDITGDITVAAPTTFSDPLTLGTPGGSIFVNGQLTGVDDASLTFTSSDATTVLNADVITNGNPITFGNSVQLGNTVTVATNGGNIATGAPITFANTINATTAGAQGLTVNAGSGNASFNGPVGNTQPLSNLTVNAGNISLAGIGTTTQAGVTGNTNFQTPGSITFSGNTYNANTQNYVGNSIAVNSGNITTFTASSDPITFQGPITLGNSGLTIDGASTIDTNSINGTGPINFTADNNINTNMGNIATNGGAIALTSGGIITAGTIDSSIRNTPSRGAPITLRHQGNSFIVNGTPANGSSSSGTITSRSNNVIPNGNFTGPFTGTYIQDDIAIIGPPVTPSIPPGQPGGNSGNVPIPPTGYPPGPNPTTKPQPPEDLGPRAPKIDLTLSKEPVKPFENYYGANFTQKQFSLPELQDNLERLEKATGKKLAIINVDTESKILTLITPKDNTVVAIPLTVTSEALRDKANLLRREIADPSNVTSSRYLTTSRQLYGWLIKPLEADLQAKKIDTLIFQLDSGLRLTPLAALNDGKQFLVEKYAISLIPSINLLDTSYDPERVRASKVLAMGASTFKDDVPLPAVPAELRNVTQEAGGSVFLNENFTLGNLKAKTASYGLIHLATHADFNRGPVQGSYIKLSDTRLGLNQMRDLGWSQQKIELLVLSACRTAFGDSNTELGFAGLAVGAGVKTAVATLWRSSDLGTFGLMSDFYDELKTASIKADALRAAQVAMLRGEVRVENGQLRFKKATFPLPEDLKALGEVRLTHPYYWSGFTMIGSPW
jgi:filamentous hemagglutinin family protein